jgi:putative ABC transport system permease protein
MSDHATPAWRRYLRFWGSDIRGDVDDELSFHLQARYDENIARGMDEASARADAELRFGNVSSFREECAQIDERWERQRSLLDTLHIIGTDVRFALRQLRRNPALSTAAVLCFALGIGANTSIFSVVDAVLFRPLPFPSPERLVLVGEGLPRFGPDNFGVISAPEYTDYRRLVRRVFQGVSAYETASLTVSGGTSPERVAALRASGSIFSVLGVPAALGRTLNSGDDEVGAAEVAVLSSALWHKRYSGDRSIIGKAIDIEGKPTIVVGVMNEAFHFPLPGVGGDAADVFVPYRVTSEVERRRANDYSTYLLARLAPGVTMDAARRAVADIAAHLPDMHPDGYGPHWVTTTEVFPLRDRAVRDVRAPLLVLLSAVGLVLLIACINVASLLLAHAAARSREISVRQALGASRGRLIRQFLAESAVLALIGGALGTIVAVWGARALAMHAPRALPEGFAASVDLRVLAVTAAIVIVTAVLFSIVPTMGRRDAELAARLRDEGRSGTSGPSRQRSRRALVVSELALALMLSSAAGLMVRSFLRATQMDPGFEAKHLLTVRIGLPATQYPTSRDVLDTHRRILERLRQLPGIREASATSSLPMSTPSRIAFALEGVTLPKIPIAANEIVMPGYFDAMHIPLVAGRAFDRSDEGGSLHAAVVNEELAHMYFKKGDAVGHRMKWGTAQSSNPWLTIVGVTANVRESALDQKPEPTVYFPALQQDTIAGERFLRSLAYVIRVDGDPATAMPGVRSAVREVDPQLALADFRSMIDVVDVSVAERRFNTVLLGAFASMALLLASAGVYGLIAHSVVQRSREIGIRLAMGATPHGVLSLVVGDGLRLSILALAFGLIGAFVMSRAMRALLFDISPLDPVSFAAAAALLLAVATVASYLPARRVARIDPQDAMRGD